MNQANHWDQIYSSRSPRQLGWYAPHLETSLDWIADLALGADDPIIDIGGGVSSLVDDLLGLGYRDLSVLDLSEEALAVVRQRLGDRASEVTWLAEDVTEVDLPEGRYRLWHDRAVFHFLTGAEQQRRYRDRLLQALRVGGSIIIGCFAPQAPPRCSGLPVQRYDIEGLCERMGAEFELKRHRNEMHFTPSGVEQAYLYCLFERRR